MYDYSKLPYNLQDAMRQYIEKGIPPGDFLRACLENDLISAVRYAGPPPGYNTGSYLRSVCLFLLNELPALDYDNTPWGTRKAVDNYINHTFKEVYTT